jgi:hypothetical protein
MQHMACYIKLTPTKYHALTFDSHNSYNLMVNRKRICFVLVRFFKIKKIVVQSLVLPCTILKKMCFDVFENFKKIINWCLPKSVNMVA